MDEIILKDLAKINQDVWTSGYREGLKEGIRRYAVWHDGKQTVGVMQKPLKDVLAAIDNEPEPRKGN